VCLAALCGGVITGVALYRMKRASNAALFSRLPAADAVVVSIDFRALRKAGVLGVLGSSGMMQEPEYRAFVDQTRFDYLSDLDAALVSFHPRGAYLLLRGKFDWKKLKEYTVRQGGSCHDTLCRVAGSAPDRKISYFSLYPNVMAAAVSRDDSAATQLQAARSGPGFAMPEDPVWSFIPIRAIRNGAQVPAGTRAFARALEGADAVLLSVAPEGGEIALKMDASCRSAGDARAVVTELRETTARLRDLIAREHQTPNASDLSGVLAAGAFESKDTHALGRWPIERSFLESLAGGGR
jgi:hypothetical protein